MLEMNNVEQALRENDEIVVCTSGTSMYPMLRNRRDMAVLTRVEGELRKNDVVLYRAKNGKLILHRILKVTPRNYIIRGDNLYRKEYVKRLDALAVLKGFNRNGKYISCEDSKGYKLYILYVKLSYPIRYIIFGEIKAFLIKFRAKILKKSTKQ